MTYRPHFFLLLALVVLAGAERPKQAAPTDRQINQWIEKLGSEDFRDREVATRALWKLDQRAFTAIAKARNHPNAEVRSRIRKILGRIETLALEIKVASGKSYQPVRGLIRGKRLYNDRGYTFTNVPETLAREVFIMSANDDADSVGERFLSFTVLQDVVIFVAHDVRHREMPVWMRVGRKDGFQAAGLTLGCTDTKFRVYRKRFKRGRIVLGGNTDDGRNGRSHYVVIVQPEPSEPPAKADIAAGAKRRR